MCIRDRGQHEPTRFNHAQADPSGCRHPRRIPSHRGGRTPQQQKPQPQICGELMPELFRHSTGLAAKYHPNVPATAERPLDLPRHLPVQRAHHSQVIRGQTCSQGCAQSIRGRKRTAIGDGSGAAHSSTQGRKMTASNGQQQACLLYTSPSPRDKRQSRMSSSA